MPSKDKPKKRPYTVYLPPGQADLFDRLVRSEIYGDGDSDVIRYLITNELKERFKEEWAKRLQDED